MFFHLHKWRYVQGEPKKDTMKQVLRVLGYAAYAEQSEQYRRCSSCERIQFFDIDGWCYPLSEDSLLQGKIAALIASQI